MKRSIRKLISVICLTLAVLLLCACAQKPEEEPENDGIPEAAVDALTTYLEKAHEGADVAINYLYFQNEDHKNAYLGSEVKGFADYSIKSSEKINDKLYAFTVSGSKQETPEEYSDYYYFVAEIDGKYQFLLG